MPRKIAHSDARKVNLFPFRTSSRRSTTENRSGSSLSQDTVCGLILWQVGSRMGQSLQRLATGWTVRGSNPGGGEIFRTSPHLPWGQPSLLYNGYRVFLGGKTAVVWRWPPTPSSAEVKERVELYSHSPSGPLWPVLGWTLPLLYFTLLWQVLVC